MTGKKPEFPFFLPDRRTMEDTKAQWHPAFCAALEMGFRKDWNILQFQREVNLSKKPLEVDLLVVKKETFQEITNSIGKIFRHYNIVEYKSPDDSLSIDTFYKTLSYGCLYKISNGSVNAILSNEITLTLMRERYPRELFKTLLLEGYDVTNAYPGIYYVNGRIPFETQIVVTSKLKDKENEWLRGLKRNLTLEEFTSLVDESSQIKEEKERQLAEAVLEVVAQANEKQVKIWKEKMAMTETVRRIFEPELQRLAHEDAILMAQDLAQDLAQNLARDMAQKAIHEEEKNTVIRLLKCNVSEQIILDAFPQYTAEDIAQLKENNEA